MYRHVFDKIGKSLNLKNWEEWYEIGHKEIVQHGGGIALGFYSGSIQALMSVYPEYNWQIWKFKHIPSTLWKSQKTQRQFFESLAKKLSISKPSDWGRITLVKVREHGGGTVLNIYNGSLHRAIKILFKGNCNVLFFFYFSKL